jgi:hypothetical protein
MCFKEADLSVAPTKFMQLQFFNVFTKMLYKHAFSNSWNKSLCYVTNLFPVLFLLSRKRNGKNYQQNIILPVKEGVESVTEGHSSLRDTS